MKASRSCPFAALLAALIAAAPPASAANTDPCTLLTDREVRKVFANAKAGQLDRSKEKYGIVTCVWDHPGGTFFVQQSSHELGSWANESRGMIDGFIDPLRREARKAVRFEPLAGVGDRAMAVVERKDEARGILNDVAQLVVQVGPRQVRLFSSQLPQRERPDALAALQTLGRAAAGRL